MQHWLKHVHVTAVALSLGGFVLRGIWMLRDSPLLRARVTRVLPHVIDSVLLASAIALAIVVKQYPFVHGWLTAKVMALVLYIVLGSIALKRDKAPNIRFAAWLGALLVFAYIILVAVSVDPMPGGFLLILRPDGFRG